MSVIIYPVYEAVEHVINESLRTQVLSRPMIAEIVTAGVTAIETNPADYLTYYGTHAKADAPALKHIDDHIETLRRAGKRATSWVGARRIHIPSDTPVKTSLHGSYQINDFLRHRIGRTQRPVPPRTPSHFGELSPSAAASLGHQWLAYSRSLALWREGASAENQYLRQLARETIETLLVDAFGPWLGR